MQEHQFTLLQIKNLLDSLGLKFCGFEVQSIASRFREFYGEESDICDLELWHRYEQSNPGAFAGMYQFWCQKRKKKNHPATTSHGTEAKHQVV